VQELVVGDPVELQASFLCDANVPRMLLEPRGRSPPLTLE